MNIRRLRVYEDALGPFQRIVDLILIVLVHRLAIAAYGQPWLRPVSSATLFVIVAFTIVAEAVGVYRPRRAEDLLTESKPLLLTWMGTAAVCAVILFLTKTSETFSRVTSLGWLLGAAGAQCAWRVGERSALRWIGSREGNQRVVAFAGATPNAERLCGEIRSRPWLGLKIAGIYDDRGPERQHAFEANPCQHVGSLRDLVQACRDGAIDVVYIALPLHAEERVKKLVEALSNSTATVHLVADLPSYELLSARWTAIGRSPLISIHDTPFQGMRHALKRVEDVVGGAIASMLIAIPVLVIALLVKLTSPGPVFFRQRRYGLNGKEIRVLKFRTMYVCEDGTTIKQAQRNDSRVTPLGRFLRRTSLDELPQFFQVLTGDMSVVGPRPHAVAHNEQYRGLIPRYMLRHKVKPGITGWAQVNGWRGETATLDRMEKRIQHDLEYIDNWSLLWDLKIVLRTIFGGSGRAY